MIRSGSWCLPPPTAISTGSCSVLRRSCRLVVQIQSAQCRGIEKRQRHFQPGGRLGREKEHHDALHLLHAL